MDVDGYKIVNVDKPLPTRLQASDLLVFPHPFLHAGDFNFSHADWCYGADSADGECLAGWASIDSLAFLYDPKDSASSNSGRWNSGTTPDLSFVRAGWHSHLPDRRIPHREVSLVTTSTIVNHTTKVCFAYVKHAR